MALTTWLSPILQCLFSLHDIIERIVVKHSRFLLLMLFILGAGYIYVSHMQSTALQQQLLQSPKIDDVYIVDLGRIQTERQYQPQYRIAQVRQVAENQVVLAQSDITYRRKRDAIRAIKLDSLMLDSFFRSERLTFERTQLAPLFKIDAIDDAYRARDIYVMGGIVKQRQKPLPINHKITSNLSLTVHNSEGIRLYQQKDFTLALAAFNTAAKAGDAWAQYNLAGMFELGEGTNTNLTQAHYWYKKAALQGHQRAQHALTLLCESQPLYCKSQTLSDIH
ncbi:hypothetical protein CWB96_17695 [Pseudoalteromonas citrea]|uniref:Sel1 repeat family protein n=1 Tax=Pseudoalteromonas citrea TaxID=43655 RepID=A0A5S3XMI1_9GAMM|nr:tetratricopeptide repeat protein [Pseudoalteromonas citrea]TMP43806.1 hypothetical protein CWB97_08090 [Pseudoalteromonas citrea]TMP55356.1 hypothetical protein CWB96_17695 [Pseudoalteromonas citrea]